MTGTEGPIRPGDPPQRSAAQSPEWSLDLLADLHAGALTEQAATSLRARAIADPQARTVLAALDATVADLAALPTQRSAEIPDAVAQRLDAALAAEVQRADRPPAHLPDRARTGRYRAARQLVTRPAGRRRARARWVAAGVLAAAVIGVTVAGAMIGVMSGGTPRAGDALGAAAVSPPTPLVLSSGDLSGALSPAWGARDYGALSRPEALQGCLDANGVPARDKPLGAREVTLDGRRGVILVLPSTQSTQFRLLVVGLGCGPGNPARMADAVARHR
ncbi:MAG TPA: hypothetical protein VHH53_05475 [Pseudonocardiaceae bacterium]|nr:hypothetical protein [Pseudonocardiaceae bacterium]